MDKETTCGLSGTPYALPRVLPTPDNACSVWDFLLCDLVLPLLCFDPHEEGCTGPGPDAYAEAEEGIKHRLEMTQDSERASQHHCTAHLRSGRPLDKRSMWLPIVTSGKF